MGAAEGSKVPALIRQRAATARGARGGTTGRSGPAARRAGSAVRARVVADHGSYGPGSERCRRMADRLAAPGRDRATVRRADCARQRATCSIAGPPAGARRRQGGRQRSLAAPARWPGRPVVWSYTPLRDVVGALLGVLAQGSTVAPLGELAPAAADDQLRLKAIMDNVADGIVVLDNQGVIVSFSRPAEAIFGYRRSEVIGRTAGMLILPGPGEAGQGLDLVLGGGNVPGETRETMARAQERRGHPDRARRQPRQFQWRYPAHPHGAGHHIAQADRGDDPQPRLPRSADRTAQSPAVQRSAHPGDRAGAAPPAAACGDDPRSRSLQADQRFLGLASGDQVLRAVGERLVGLLRRSDTVARLGGDDFLLLLPGVDGAESAAKVAQKLLDVPIPWRSMTRSCTSAPAWGSHCIPTTARTRRR